jgi:hypothetical protein
MAQLKQLASQGQDAQTAAQVDQYVDKNQDAISAILAGYVNYLKQVQAMAADDGTGPPPGPRPPQTSGTSTTAQSPPANTAPPNSAPPNGGPQTAALQPSTGLQTATVQPSGGLQTSHLAGYPALPAVDPVSTVTTLSAAQAAYALKVQKENEARKAYLMAHPAGYSY